MVIIWILLNFLLYYVLFAAMKVAVFSAFWQKFICSKFAVQSVHQCAKQVKNVQKCACVQFDIYSKSNDLSFYVPPISIRKSIIYVLRTLYLTHVKLQRTRYFLPFRVHTQTETITLSRQF